MTTPIHAVLFRQPAPVRLDRVSWPARLRIVTLGPHPDDFDVVAVTLRHLRAAGAQLDVSVLSTGISGVEDAYCPPDRKAATRREEQRASCRLFGLPDNALHFLPLAEDEAGEPADTEPNRELVSAWLVPRQPQLVFLPHGNDQKGGHRNVYALFRAIVERERLTVTAFLNSDPKTVRLRTDAWMPYDEATGRWKAALLRCHDSQQQRNVNTRGRGFDDRILEHERAGAKRLGAAEPYAEIFEVEHFIDGQRTS